MSSTLSGSEPSAPALANAQGISNFSISEVAMCVPAAIAIPAAVSVAAKVGEAVAGHIGQQQAHDQNRASALAAHRNTLEDLHSRWFEEQEATAQSIMGTDRQARSAEALARVSAGESGVAGASVDALLGDIERERATAEFSAQRNLEITKGQLKRAARSSAVETQNRINAVPAPNPWLTGLRIGGSVASAGTDIVRSLPNPGGK